MNTSAQSIRSIDTISGASAAVMLRARGLTKSFGGQNVLDDLSVDLNKGEVVLLRGDNGAGKTTLLNILTGNLEPDAGVIHTSTDGITEEFSFPARWWNNLNPFNHFTPERIAREGIGRTWQEVRLFGTADLLDNLSVAVPNQIGENPLWSFLRFAGWKRQEIEINKESSILLDKVGLSGRDRSSADKISLGQSKRVAIARAVRAGARILFLDEPLAGLDAHGIEEVLNLLKELSHLENMTLVIVEHVFNIPHILNIATTIWTLSDGRIVRENPDQLSRAKQEINNSQFNLWINDMPGQRTVTEEELPGGAVLSTIMLDGSNNPNNSAVLEVEDLVVYRGKRMVIGEQSTDGKIQGLSFSLRKGQLAVLQAPNGWGKTTLLEAVAGLIPIGRGSIRLNGKPVEKLSIWQRVALGMSFLQSRNNIFPNLSVKEALAVAGLKTVPQPVQHLLSRQVSDLSGGEKQRLLTSSLLLKNKYSVQLLDEPFSALDPKRTEELKSILFDILDTTALLVAVPSTLHSKLSENAKKIAVV